MVSELGERTWRTHQRSFSIGIHMEAEAINVTQLSNVYFEPIRVTLTVVAMNVSELGL